MKDLWTILSYPAAAVSGYFIALGSAENIATMAGLDEWAATVGILVFTAVIVGFLVDEVIPTYIHDVREGNTGGGGLDGGGGDFGGGGDADFDFD